MNLRSYKKKIGYGCLFYNHCANVSEKMKFAFFRFENCIEKQKKSVTCHLNILKIGMTHTQRYKFILAIAVLLLLSACSPRIDTFYNRWSQPLFTRFNVMFNGEEALRQGKEALDVQYQEDFSQILPVEAVADSDEIKLRGEENTFFEKAEQKAAKAIQRHSMIIDGKQKNHRIDQAYLLLGKARYYNRSYISALEAFQYLLYNYSESEYLGEAAIWREKTNVRLGKDEIAMRHLIRLVDSLSMKPEVESEARATLAQSLIHLERNSLAVVQLQKAAHLTKKKALKGRYYFICGQLEEADQLSTQAAKSYRQVLDLNWSVPRILWVEALSGVARNSDFSKEERVAFSRYLSRVSSRYEHKDFLDILHYAHAELLRKEDVNQAIDFYEKSIRYNAKRPSLALKAHQAVAMLYFDKKDYLSAYKHYEQAYALAPDHTLEKLHLKQKRDNLNVVALLERQLRQNEQILSLENKSKAERVVFYEKYQKELLERKKDSTAKVSFSQDFSPLQVASSHQFYFYNPVSVLRGIQAFQRRWGVFELQDDWFMISAGRTDNVPLADSTDILPQDTQPSVEEWLATLPQTASQWDLIRQERNQLLYELGEVYRLQFGETERAVEKWRQLYNDNQATDFREKVYYQLHKAYESLVAQYQNSDAQKTQHFRQLLADSFPKNQYVADYDKKFINTADKQQRIEVVYDATQRYLKENNYRAVLSVLDTLHFESLYQNRVKELLLLKAKMQGRLEGIETYERQLQGLKKAYKGTDFSVSIDSMIGHLKPLLLDRNFVASGRSWKLILRKVPAEKEQSVRDFLNQQIASDEKLKQLTLSKDIYDKKEDWLVIHHIKDKVQLLSLLKEWKKEWKDYELIPISQGNYARVQRFKNIADYYNYWKSKPVDF